MRFALFQPGLWICGERGRNRTCDPRLKRALLYQLSYAPSPRCMSNKTSNLIDVSKSHHHSTLYLAIRSSVGCFLVSGKQYSSSSRPFERIERRNLFDRCGLVGRCQMSISPGHLNMSNQVGDRRQIHSCHDETTGKCVRNSALGFCFSFRRVRGSCRVGNTASPIPSNPHAQHRAREGPGIAFPSS